MKNKATHNISLNADEREILERLHLSQGNSAKLSVNDCSFGRERFVRALDNLLLKAYIDTDLCPSDPMLSANRIGFSFGTRIHDDSTGIEIIKTEAGEQHLMQNRTRENSIHELLHGLEQLAETNPQLAKEILDTAARIKAKQQAFTDENDTANTQ